MTKIELIVQKYLHQKTSNEENQLLISWIRQSDKNKRRFFSEKDIWDTYGLHSDRKMYEVDSELEILKNKIKYEKFHQKSNLKRFIQIAAVLLVAFGLGWGIQFVSGPSNPVTQTAILQDIFVPKGQVNQVFLSDGTRIWINSESRLVVPSFFNSNERVVKLKGEAFFVVSKDKKRPFRVEVNGQTIEVLGTSFNVRAYENSNKIETTLETGQVRLLTGGKTTILKPGEQSLFDKSNHSLTISSVGHKSFSAWKDGRFEFQNEDLIEVFKIVERWYDVEITADETYFKGMHFSGVIKRNKDARHFLDLLNLTIPVKYEIVSDKIKISPKESIVKGKGNVK